MVNIFVGVATDMTVKNNYIAKQLPVQAPQSPPYSKGDPIEYRVLPISSNLMSIVKWFLTLLSLTFAIIASCVAATHYQIPRTYQDAIPNIVVCRFGAREIASQGQEVKSASTS